MDAVDILIAKEWIHNIEVQLNKTKLVERLDPKSSAQHARLMIALNLTENQQIWTHSFKHFIKSPSLYLIKHQLQFSTIDEKHTISRLISKFLAFGEDRFDHKDEGKWETSCLMWMLFTQPLLLTQLIDPFNLNLLLNEQFRKIGPNQQAEFFSRISMLITNLDTLTVVRKHFHLSTKLSQASFFVFL